LRTEKPKPSSNDRYAFHILLTYTAIIATSLSTVVAALLEEMLGAVESYLFIQRCPRVRYV
jgi:hypothetical protein